MFLPFVVVIVLPASYASCKVTAFTFAEQLAIWLEAFEQRAVDPAAPRVGTWTRLLKIIWPDPPGVTVKLLLDVVEISAVAPVKVRPVDPMDLLVSVCA